MNQVCPLCEAPSSPYAAELGLIGGREFLRCSRCALVFVLRKYLLSADDEHARYLTHQNTPDNPGYREFLDRLLGKLLPKLAATASGLDFGAGPGTTLATLCAERGFQVEVYDPFFHPDPRVLAGTYDFVTCSEAVEHFHFPKTEFQRLHGLLKPRGWLGVMTQLLEPGISFPSWYYQRDPTHVSFYSRETFVWIAGQFDWDYEFSGQGVVLFRRR